LLDRDELTRYARQIAMPDFGAAAQERLKAARVVVAGVGGLGCASSLYLAAAGVGHLTLVDHDTVSLSDLNRQVLYTEDDLGQKKVFAAAGRLARLNPRITITPIDSLIDAGNAAGIVGGAQAVVDGFDNAAARLAMNQACVEARVPYIYGGVSGLRGMATTILPGVTPCLACFRPAGVGGQGVLGAAAAVIAEIQALEAVKLLTGKAPSLAGRLFVFHGDEARFSSLEIKRNPACPVCGSIV
jgi:molybdopterin/thiamine biosynthesis adenylyltransferase